MARRTGQKYFLQKTRLVWKNQTGKHTRTNRELNISRAHEVAVAIQRLQSV